MIAAMLIGWEGQQTKIVNNLRLYCAIAAPRQLPAEYPTVAFNGPTNETTGGLMATFVLDPKLEMPAAPMVSCPWASMAAPENGWTPWASSVVRCASRRRIRMPSVPSGGYRPPGRRAPRGTICEAAADARARRSPAAPNLEAQCRASTPPPPPPPAAITGSDLQQVAARGAMLANNDALASELRRRLPNEAQRHGFDMGMGIWAGNTAPGPGKLRYRDLLAPNEQPGFDIAAAFSLPRNKYALQSQVGAAIANKDRAVSRARNTENDVFFWLGFDIASGIFGNRADGAQGNTATGPGSLGVRNELSAAGQRRLRCLGLSAPEPQIQLIKKEFT